MKALYVFHRIFHYSAVVFFILAGVLAGVSLFYGSMLLVAGYELVGEVAPIIYLLGMVIIALVVLGAVNLITSHVFKVIHTKLLAKQAKEAECSCDCGCTCCCECKCEEKSDLDAQVEEVMKWKNLYVEGIITEREFIDKRNEILRLSK